MAKHRLNFLHKTHAVKFISISFICIGTLALASGIFTNPSFSYTDTKTIHAPIETAWSFLLDFETHPLHKRHLSKGVTLSYNIVSQTAPNQLTLRGIIPHYRFDATWNYKLTALSDTQTSIAITEHSTVHHFWFRLLLSFIGRHSIVNQEFEALERLATANNDT